MKLVLDSNIYVAAFATHGLCQALFEHCLENHEIFIGYEILAEVKRILIKKIKQPEDLTNQQIHFLRSHLELIDAPKLESPVSRDPNDDHVLSLAYEVKAMYLITGDKDLLVLKKYKSIPIVTPRIFWEKVTKA